MSNDLEISITAKTLGSFRAYTDAARSEMQTQLDTFMRDELEHARDELVRASPRGPEPYDDPAHVHMQDAWTLTQTSARHGVIANPTPQATYQFTGTRAHVIEARNKQTLAFIGRGGGLVFARSVNHPGTAQNLELVGAMDSEVKRIRSDFALLGMRLAATYARAVKASGDR